MFLNEKVSLIGVFKSNSQKATATTSFLLWRTISTEKVFPNQWLWVTFWQIMDMMQRK